MDHPEALQRVTEGEPLRQLAAVYREDLIRDLLDQDPADVSPTLFQKETTQFMNKLCRLVAERHSGERRMASMLVEYIEYVSDYDAYDALLGHFEDFEGRPQILQKGKVLFAGPMTAHWDSSW